MKAREIIQTLGLGSRLRGLISFEISNALIIIPLKTIASENLLHYFTFTYFTFALILKLLAQGFLKFK